MLPAGVPLFDGECQLFTAGLSGAYDVAGATFPCRLAHNRTGAGDSSGDRAELAAARRLIWDPAVSLPEHCEVAGPDGVRWAPVAGTFARYTDWTGSPVYRVALAVRQQDAAF